MKSGHARNPLSLRNVFVNVQLHIPGHHQRTQLGNLLLQQQNSYSVPRNASSVLVSFKADDNHEEIEVTVLSSNPGEEEEEEE